MPTNRLLAAIAALLLSTGVARATTPPLFTYSGFLQDSSGNPVTGVHDFTFRFYNQPTAGSQIGTDVAIGSVPVAADGYFSVVVDVTGFSSSFSAQTYMAVKLDLESFMSPRIQLTSVPGALSVPFGGVTGWPTSQCPASQFAVGYDVNGNLVCGAEGGVSSVSAGAGITVTGSSSVTVAANLATAGGDNGSASTIARSDHVHDARYPTAASLQASGTLNAPGNPVDWTKLKGVPAALADGDDGITTLMGAGPVTTSVSGAVATVGLQACAASEVLQYNGAAWACTASPYASPGGGLMNNGPGFTLNASGCPTGGVLKYNGSGSWNCQADANSGGTVWSVTGTGPLSVASPTTAAVISMTAAAAFQPGYLTTTDWSAFNAKQARVVGTCAAGSAMTAIAADGTATCAADANSGGTVTNVSAQGGTPLSVTNGTSTPVINMTQASASGNGYLTSSDWNNFNNKLASNASVGGDLSGTVPSSTVVAIRGRAVASTAPVDGQVLKWASTQWVPSADTDTNSGGTVTSVSATSGGGLAVTGTATLTPSVGMRTDCAANQLLKWIGGAWTCAADVDTTNPGTVTNVTASGPLSVTNGSSTPAISLAAASSLQPGYVTTTDWGAFNAKQARVYANCPAGYFMTAIAADGSVTCVVDGNSGGTVTSVATGAGLTGGPITGSGTISIPTGGVTSAMILDGTVSFADWSQNGCAANQVPKWNGSAWACAADVDTNSGGTVTSVATGAGLAGGPITGSGTISIPTGGVTSAMILDGTVSFADMSLNGCATGQIPKVSSGIWTCSTDTSGTVTSVTAASAPLSVATGTTTPVISITQANNAVSGYVSSTDWNTFNGKQARVTGTCSSGISSIAADGTVTCSSDSFATYAAGGGFDPTTAFTALGVSATVTTTSQQHIQWVASKAFGSTAVGGAANLNIYPCYRFNGSGWFPMSSGIFGLQVPQNTRQVFTISAAALFSAGTFNLGMCGSSTTPGNWNNDEWGYVSAIVFD